MTDLLRVVFDIYTLQRTKSVLKYIFFVFLGLIMTKFLNFPYLVNASHKMLIDFSKLLQGLVFYDCPKICNTSQTTGTARIMYFLFFRTLYDEILEFLISRSFISY